LRAPRWKSVLRNFVGNRYPGLDPADVSDVVFVSGHSLSTGLRAHFPAATIRESVLLRDPASRFVSLYNYRWQRFEMGLGPAPRPFETWYRGQRRDSVSRFLLNRYFAQAIPWIYRLSSHDRLSFLERRLRNFHFVGCYSRADELVAGISRELGIATTAPRQNVTRVEKLRVSDLSTSMRNRLNSENSLDKVLYDRWARRGWRSGSTPPPARLPRFDQLSYIASDVVTAALKVLVA
jgi:hypothetical protein